MNEAKKASWQTTHPLLPYRILASILAALCIVAFFLPYHALVSSSTAFHLAEKNLFRFFEYFSKAPYKPLGLIPMFANPRSIIGLAGNALFYLLLFTLVITFFLAIASILSHKKTKNFLFLAVLCFTWGTALYTIGILAISCYITTIKITFDASSLLLAALGCIAYFALMYAKLGKASVANAGIFLLTFAFTLCITLGLTHNSHLVSDMLSHGIGYELILLAAIFLTIANMIFASVRAYYVDTHHFDFFSALVELFIAGIILIMSVLSPTNDYFCIILCSIAAVIALTLLTVASLFAHKQKAMAEAEITAAIPAEASSAPACLYGQTFEGVTPASYFNDKPNDKFIESLSNAERSQFADLYVVKNRAPMPEIPAYEIGGDNKNFFEMIFVTLGLYRDNIPDGLLGKMYDFMQA
ncbi:MAG: hypothetical protein IJV83_00575 [Clostridia bacterium]|nr:hypothetical protein [Clostridia bacterium]